MPENRRFCKAIALALIFVSLLAASSSAMEMDLLQGNVKRGSVTVEDRNGMRFVALEEVMSRLAFAPSPAAGGFVVTYSGKKIEFWNGSGAARVNGSVSPLAVAVSYDGTHWWGEAASCMEAISWFLSSVSRPSDIKLVEAGARAQPQAPKNAPVAPPISPPPAPPPVSTAAPASSEIIVSRVRWGEQTDAYRAVIDISDRAEATLREYQDRVEVVFKNVRAGDVTGRSPWPSLSVSSRQEGADAVLTFARLPGAVKGFWVADPYRYVVDFYFDGPSAEPTPAVSGGGAAPPEDGAVPPRGTIETNPKRTPPPAKKKFLVVVDAGHGGHDGGAVGNGLKEKDMNLLAALQLGISLKALGIDVKLTRQDDRYLKLAERTEIANNTDADVFISLHCNALPKGQRASGTELYLMAEQTDQDALNLAIIENRELSGGAESSTEVDEAADKRTRLLLKILGDMQQSDKISESTNLAEFLYGKIASANFRIRKVRQAPFFVLRGAGMPALLVEMGYITDAGDAKMLNSQASRKKMMDALASGISDYLSKRLGEGGRT